MERIIGELSEAWEQYARVAPSLSEDEEQQQYLSLAARVEAAARNTPGVPTALRGVVRLKGEGSGTPPEGFRDFVRGVITPNAMLALDDPEAFAHQLEVGFPTEVVPVKAALMLPVASQLVDDTNYAEEPLDYQWSWFAGTPVSVPGDDWPRRADGTALRHVLQVALNEEADNVADLARTGLPETGVLQIFHDLTTYGEPGDADLHAWHVRLLEDPEGDLRDSVSLAPWPEDLPEEARVAAVPINADIAATISSPLDVDSLDDEEFERYERLRAYLDWWPTTRNIAGPPVGPSGQEPQGDPWAPGYVPVDPLSHLGGFGHVESNPDYVKVLHTSLPVTAGDEHVLLADINPRQFTEADWFHGGRHLEVWIRRSDLDAERFDHVWCFIRTDC